MTRAIHRAAVLTAYACSLVLGVWSPPATAQPSGVAVGRTVGSFAVSPGGQANYSIPILTPKGIAGLTPSLSLVYSSGSGDGMYGVGWSVSGFSAVTRCQKTYGQDGFSANVYLTSADLYCLDGNKLRSFAGTTYGADGAQYQTEIADFSLVISHGSAGGAGPAWFEVHGKNGLIYQYGNTTDSALLATGTSIVITWALNRITDRFGNHIDFVYTNDAPNQVLRPDTITYTTPPSGVSGVQTTANYQVLFTYESRPTTSTIPGGYVTGAKFLEPYRTQMITVGAWNGSAYAAVRTYYLNYTIGTTTSRSQLTRIQECSPTQCFAATTVGYQNGTPGWSSAVATPGKSTTLENAWVVDLNGDGVDDIVYEDTSNVWHYMLGTISGTFEQPYALTFTPVAAIDYNSDGKMDLLAVSSGYLHVMSFSSPGSAFTDTNTNVPAPANAGLGYLIVGDVDGDGRDDIIYAVSSGSSWTTPDHIYYRLNTGGGFGPQQTLATIQGSAGCTPGQGSAGVCRKLALFPFGQVTPYYSRVRRPDVNGDGRLDFFVDITHCAWADGKCSGSPTPTWNLYVSDASVVGYDQLDALSDGAVVLPPIFGDFNGDGCTDVATVGSNGHWLIQYGTCLRSGALVALSTAVDTQVVALPGYPLVIDWDGDGMDDIVQSNSATGGTLYYAKSTGTSLDAFVTTGIPYDNGDAIEHAAVVADINGDGLYDIVFPTTSANTVSVLTHQGATVTPDLATSFTDGFGINFSPDYVQLTNSTTYTKGSGAVFPEQDIQTSATVVSSYSASDGIGGTYSVTEHYTQARQNLQRRQFEGYGSMLSLDSRDSLYRNTSYAQLSPTTGMITEQSVKQSDNATYISDVLNTLTFATLDAAYKRYFPYVSKSVATTHEYAPADGSYNGQPITQKTTTVQFGGPNGFTYGNPSKITTTTVDQDPNSPWPNATFTDTVSITPYETGGTSSTGWCIRLATKMTDQRMQPGGATLTHSTSYAVDQKSECEVDSKTIESGTVDQLVTAYAYDGCGNVNSVTVTGQIPSGNSTPAARPTGTSYGSHCIYPEKVTNALNQSSSMGYRYDLGLQTSSTDPNNLTTGWTYNDIGQKRLEQRPDGTQTSYILTACTNHCGSSQAPLQYHLNTYEQDSTSSHTTFRQHVDYYDQLGRLILDQVQSSANQWISTETDYDNLGRLHDKSIPTTGSTTTAYFTTYAYDVLNRRTSISRPISSTNPTLEHTYYTYLGRKATTKDPRGYITTNQSDVIGELGIVTDPDGVSKTTYGYDPFGNLTSITDPGPNHTTRTFDTLGYLLTATSDSDRGSWTFQYDSFGELINLRDAKTSSPNWTQQLTYDALGRTTQRVEAEGTTTWTWGTSAANHEIGQLKQIANLTIGDTDINTFDSAGRLATRSMLYYGTTYTVSYSYNTIGKLNALTYPLASGQPHPFEVLYGYTYGYLSSLQNYTGGVAGTTFWRLTSGATNMDPWGHVIDETLGTTTAVRIQSAFDGVTGWINSRTVGSGGSLNNIQNLAYQWDLNGNLHQREDVIQNLTEVFNYDNLNRIQTSTLNGTQNLSVSIDNTGNVMSRTEGGITYPYTYDTTHTHAVATVGTSPHQTTYSYDANGNMSLRGGSNTGNAEPIVWTSYNLPTLIAAVGNGGSTMFFYGPDRRLLEQLSNYVADGQSGSESTVYVFGLYEYETTPAQNHNKYFIQVPGGTQIVYDIQSISGAQTTYITADHLGSGNIFLNSAGRKLLNESFSAYGYRRSSNWSRPLSSTSSDYTTIASTTRRGYTDAFHEVFDNLDLIQMRGRVYDPVIGRFMSPDPIVTQVGNSQSINPYSYVQNRPLTLTDPTGMAVSRNQPIDPLRNLGRLSWQQARRLGLTGEISGVAPTGTANQGDSWQALQGYSTAVGNGSSSGGSVGFTQDPSLAQLNQPPPNPQGTADPTLNAASAQGAAAAAPPSDQTSTTTEGGSPDDLQPVNVTAQYKDPETGKLLPPNVSVTPDGQYMIRGTTIPLAPMPGCTGLCAAMTNSTVYGGNSYVRETPGSNGTKVDVVTTDQNGDVFDVTTFSLIDPNQGSGYNTWRSFGDWWAENGDGKQQGTQQQGTQQQN